MECSTGRLVGQCGGQNLVHPRKLTALKMQCDSSVIDVHHFEDSEFDSNHQRFALLPSRSTLNYFEQLGNSIATKEAKSTTSAGELLYVHSDCADAIPVRSHNRQLAVMDRQIETADHGDCVVFACELQCGVQCSGEVAARDSKCGAHAVASVVHSMRFIALPQPS